MADASTVQGYIAKIEAILASGVSRAQEGDSMIGYQAGADLLAVLKYWKGQLSELSGQSRRTVVNYSSGYRGWGDC